MHADILIFSSSLKTKHLYKIRDNWKPPNFRIKILKYINYAYQIYFKTQDIFISHKNWTTIVSLTQFSNTNVCILAQHISTRYGKKAGILSLNAPQLSWVNRHSWLMLSPSSSFSLTQFLFISFLSLLITYSFFLHPLWQNLPSCLTTSNNNYKRG